jgi:hypothetical protein
MELAFELDYPDQSVVQRPGMLRDCILALDRAGDVVTGTLSMPGDPTTVTAVSGRVEGGSLRLNPGSAGIVVGGSVGWSMEWAALRLDADGEDAVGGEGEATGRWQGSAGDAVDSTTFHARVVAQPDTSADRARLLAPRRRSPDTILPTDTLEVDLHEAVDEEAAAGGLALLADGAPAATFRPEPPDDEEAAGLVAHGQLQPAAFLPFGATLSLATGDLVDLAGNPLRWDGRPLHVIDDPGDVLSNLDFEQDLTGWTRTSGAVVATGSYAGVAPTSGASQLVVTEESIAAAYIDVPLDATELSMSVAVLSEIGEFDAGSAAVTLHRAGGEQVPFFDALDQVAGDHPCACSGGPAGYGHQIGPLRHSASLVPFRGERLFLVVEARSSFFIGVNFYAVIVDDIQIR